MNAWRPAGRSAAIANKASYQFKHREMDEMLEKLRAALAAKEEKK